MANPFPEFLPAEPEQSQPSPSNPFAEFLPDEVKATPAPAQPGMGAKAMDFVSRLGAQ